MLNIGRKQKLVVVKKVEFGIYLGETREAGEKERVLLPIKQVPEGTKEGDELEVFLYRDSSDRLIATTREPKLVLGELAVLNVAATGKIGAFLDWGLEKDLFLPFKQQTRRLHPGDEVLVSLYIDKSDRLCATMKVYHFLKTNSPYVVGDIVKGRIYEISGNFGVFVAVDDRYSGLIPKREAQADYHVGQKNCRKIPNSCCFRFCSFDTRYNTKNFLFLLFCDFHPQMILMILVKNQTCCFRFKAIAFLP